MDGTLTLSVYERRIEYGNENNESFGRFIAQITI